MDRILDHKTPSRYKNIGFTLLEVLVALAVLAIAMISIYKLQGQTMLMSAKARFLTVAPHLAQAKLAEIELQDLEDIGDGSGDFGTDYPSYNWAVSVEELPTDLITDNKYHLLRINVNVTQANENSYQLRTYRFYTD